MTRAELTPAIVSSLVGDLARTMVVRVSVAEILRDLVARLVEVLPVTGAGVSMIEGDGGPREFVASDPQAQVYEAVQARLQQGPCVIAFETRVRCSAPDLAREARFPQFAREASELGLAAAFAFPLLYGEQRLGAIDLYCDTPGALGEEACVAAGLVANVVAACLVNAQERTALERLADRLGVQARRDALTQLPNRNVLLERLELARSRHKRSGLPFAVLFIDVDAFKSVNDRFGHRTGDEALRAFAERLGAAVRPVDLTARLGGDEFAVVCEDLRDAAEAGQIAGRIADALRAPLTAAGHQITVTASIGIAVSGPGRESASALLQASDEAMYAAKPAVNVSTRARGLVEGPASSGGGVADAEAVGNAAGDWRERLIRGDAAGEVAFSSVLINRAASELVITQYDRSAMMLQRYEWQPDAASDSVEVIVTDWDEQPVLRRRVASVPDAPRDLAELARLLAGIDSRGE